MAYCFAFLKTCLLTVYFVTQKPKIAKPYQNFQEREPALSIKISGEYFINNLSDQADSFTLNEDGDYERTIDQTDLTLSFDTESDCK